MKALAELLVAAIELIEAYLGRAREKAAKFAAGILLMLLAAFSALGGLALFSLGLYKYLEPVLGAAGSAFATGLAFMAVSALLALAAVKLVR